jgi:hypothetical protein
MRETCYWEPNKMKKIAVVFASAGLLALAACGEKPAEEANNAVENVVENASNVVENASNVVENASNAVENASNNAM